MTEKSTGRDSDKFMLRFPDGLRDRIKAAAEDNKRSMNAEIVARLESTINADMLEKTLESRDEYIATLHNTLKNMNTNINLLEEARVYLKAIAEIIGEFFKKVDEGKLSEDQRKDAREHVERMLDALRHPTSAADRLGTEGNDASVASRSVDTAKTT